MQLIPNRRTLSENSISRIDYGIFNGMSTLSNLVLGSNNITYIAALAFSNMTSLQILYYDGLFAHFMADNHKIP